MRVVGVRILNILGIEQLEFRPGSVTVIEGGNDEGKTSVVEAIASAFGGGKDVTLLRNGATRGEVAIELSDGTEITEGLERKDDGKIDVKRSVKHPTFGRVAAPQTYLKKLVDELSLNPISFLRAEPKRRAEMLLELLPIDVTDEQLLAAGIPQAFLPPPNRNGLDRIEAARKLLYDARTGSNRVATDKRKTIGELKAALPDAALERPNLAVLRANRQDLIEAKAQALKDVEREAALHRRTVEQALEADIAKLRAAAKVRLDAFDAQEKVQLNDVAQRFGKQLEEAAAAIATAETLAGRADADARTRQSIAQYEAEAAKAEAESAARTASIAALDGVKAEALKAFPLQGVTIRDGQIYSGDVVFDRLNTAAKVQMALSIAKLRAAELPLVCIDGLECLDEDAMVIFEQQVEASGLQVIGNRVTNGAASVRTNGAPAVPVSSPAPPRAAYAF